MSLPPFNFSSPLQPLFSQCFLSFPTSFPSSIFFLSPYLHCSRNLTFFPSHHVGTTSTRVLSATSEAIAVVRSSDAPPPKRGFTAISRASYSWFSPASNDIVEIPEVFISQETLEFLGLQPEVAQAIFESWHALQQTPEELGYGEDIITSAEYYVKRMADIEDAWRFSRDSREALFIMGVNNNLIDAILDSDFDDIRATKSACEWVIDTFRTSWEFLEGLGGRIRRKKDEVGRVATPSPSIVPKPSVLKPDTMTTVPDNIDGRIMLHKGGAMTRLVSVFNEDGSLNLSNLFSDAPTDFHQLRSDLLCFTKDIDIAKQYAKFSQRRVPVEEGIVLSFTVPTELLDEYREISGVDWRRLVWWARHPGRYIGMSQVPASLMEYVEAPVLIGHICGIAGKKIGQLESPSELTGQYYMKTKDGVNATQYVFQAIPVQIEHQARCAGWV